MGNDWLADPLRDWSPLEHLTYGWTFWGDVRVPVPLSWVGVEELYGVPLEFFLSAGYSSSSGTTGGRDYNELIEVETTQEAYLLRLYYVVPWKFLDDVRLFAGGGPLMISDQTLTATHTHRPVDTGQGAQQATDRMEQVTYSGSGLGWQLGLTAEYLIQDRITLALDLAYRWAMVDHDYDPLSGERFDGVAITDPFPEFADESPSGAERLGRDNSYLLHTFLNGPESEANEPVRHDYGPWMGNVVGLGKNEIDMDMTGFQIHLGFRFYFF
jgi:hypothetical protein